MRSREVLAILKGGAKSLEPTVFPFCNPPPLPGINDQSLRLATTPEMCREMPRCSEMDTGFLKGRVRVTVKY